MAHKYQIDFEYEGESHTIELTAEYRFFGRHIPATRFDPEEWPEVEVTRILYHGKELKRFKYGREDELTELANAAIDKEMMDELEYGGIDC